MSITRSCSSSLSPHNSHTAWCVLRVLAELDVAYGEGDYDGARAALDELADIKTVSQTRTE